VAKTPVPAASVFEELESEVRSYCRCWPTVFASAKGCYIYDELGRGYLDFFSGAGVLNYGHNNPHLREALLAYLHSDALVHSLDMYTPVKRLLLEIFRERILSPRALNYKVQFSGPAGSMAVEAAFKLARKYTGRSTIVSFTNAFHGMTMAALSVTGRAGTSADGALTHPVVLPYDGQHGAGQPGLLLLDRLLERDTPARPAAVIVETVQGEGGLHTATADWLRQLAGVCKQHGVLLIVDDVQMGCGRTGPFFSFESSGIYPDVVCISKSFSGYGLPLALTLIRPELDVWAPGEHTGTFRGFNPAYATAIAAMDFWRDGELERKTLENGALLAEPLRRLAARHDGAVTEVRGAGMAWGLAFSEPDLARAVRTQAFSRGLILETCGNRGEVVKLLPPLIADRRDLTTGIDMLADAVENCAATWAPRTRNIE
jgi:diaminobutyrate-2-oxoglutarate transaminase